MTGCTIAIRSSSNGDKFCSSSGIGPGSMLFAALNLFGCFRHPLQSDLLLCWNDILEQVGHTMVDSLPILSSKSCSKRSFTLVLVAVSSTIPLSLTILFLAASFLRRFQRAIVEIHLQYTTHFL